MRYRKHPREHLNELESTLQVYLVKKSPAIPQSIKELFVRFVPWLVILWIAMSIQAIFYLFRLGWTYYIPAVLLIIAVLFELRAVPGLFAKKKIGWDYLYYAVLANALSSLTVQNIISFIVGTLIALYILFQIREYYR